MPGSWLHLGARFFDVVAAKPLAPEESLVLERWLSPVERSIFAGQTAADQRHGFECGLEVAAIHPSRPDLIRAALLHDVGKRHASLGPIGRVAATLVIRLGRQGRGRMALYARHGPIAADELTELGAETLVVDFARHHHSARPPSIDVDDWELLEMVDRARMSPGKPATGYSDLLQGNGRS